MTGYNKRVYEMIARVLVFWTKYRDLIVKDSVPDQLFTQLDAVFQNLSTEATRRAGCENTTALSSSLRLNARKDLLAQLETICATAFGLGLEQFWMPRSRDDRALVRTGTNFVVQLEPLKQQFIDARLPEDFIEKLKMAVQTLTDAIRQQSESKGTSVEATAAILKARNQAINLVKRLDPLMENLLKNNAPVQAVWESARHIEAARSTKTADEKPLNPPPEVPGQPNTAAPANTA